MLSYFWDLASIDDEKRSEAATKLLEYMQKSQKEFQQDSSNVNGVGGGGSSSPSTLDTALHDCSPLVAYTMRRLYKGLTSGRKGARQGFALALTAAIKHLDCFNIPALIESLNDVSIGGGRDEYFGQIFGLGAIVRGASSLDVDSATAIVEQAVHLAHKKSFLREVAATVIVELAEKNQDVIAGVLENAEELRAWVTAPLPQACPEALYTAVRIWRYMPEDLKESCPLLPPNCAHVPSPTLFTASQGSNVNVDDIAVASAFFYESHLKALAPVLRNTTQGHPRLHTVWSALFDLLKPVTTTTTTTTIGSTPTRHELAQFWTVIVENDIFESTSHDRKFLGFSLFQRLLEFVDDSFIPALLSSNFIRTLSTNATKKDSALYPIAVQSLEALKRAVGGCRPEAKAAVLLAVERNGNTYLIKALSRVDGGRNDTSKGENGLTGGGSGAGPSSSDREIAARVKQLKNEFESLSSTDGTGTDVGQEEGKRDTLTSRRKSILGQLAGIARRRQGGAVLYNDIFTFMVDHGFLAPSDDDDVAMHCSGLLITTVDAVSRAVVMAQQQQHGDGKKKSTAGDKDPLDTVAVYARKQMSAKAIPKTAAEAEAAATEESKAAATTLATLRHQLSKLLIEKKDTTSEAHRQIESLKHVTSLLELHAYANPSTADASVAEDLNRVANNALSTPSGKKKQEEDVPRWEDALVDIVLSILSRNESPFPSAPLRDAAERVFKSFASHVTATGVQDLLQVIAKPLDEKDAEDGEDGEESEEGSDDEEMEEASGEGSGDDEEVEEEKEDAGLSSEEEEGENNEDDGDDDEAEDEGMTDEQMFKLDAQLGAYFVNMQKSKDTKKIRQEMIGFKLRALACLEMVMKKAPTSDLIMEMASPLLSALVSARKPSGDAALAERLGGILRNQLPRCKPTAGDMEMEEEALRAQLKRSLYYASRNDDKVVQEAAGWVFLFLIRAAFSTGTPTVAIEFVTASLTDLFDKKKTKLGRPFFQQLMKRVPDAALASLGPILRHCNPSVARNEFTQQEAFIMLDLAVKSVDDGLEEALKESADALEGAVVVAIQGTFSKKQRRSEALKAIFAVGQALKSRKSEFGDVLGVESMLKIAEALEGSVDKDVLLQRLVPLFAVDVAGGGDGVSGKKRGGGAAVQGVDVKSKRPVKRKK